MADSDFQSGKPKGRFHPPGAADAELAIRSTGRMFGTLAAMNIGTIPFDQAVTILRHAYVKAAVRQLERTQPDKRLTRSAIALLTGMDGRTVANLLNAAEQHDAGEEVPQSPHAHVLGSWASHDRWRDPETGQPARLTIYGAGNTFQALVKSTIGKSVSYSMVLETLMENGNIRKVGDNCVELVDRMFRSRGDRSQQRQSSRLLHGLAKNIVHYLEIDDHTDTWPRGMIWNQRVRPDRLAELRERLRTLLADDIAYQIGETIDTCAEQDDHEGQATAGIGWYYWEDR